VRDCFRIQLERATAESGVPGNTWDLGCASVASVRKKKKKNIIMTYDSWLRSLYDVGWFYDVGW
jgi:hypothetical protein